MQQSTQRNRRLSAGFKIRAAYDIYDSDYTYAYNVYDGIYDYSRDPERHEFNTTLISMYADLYPT
jgi:hypothetical protein